MHQILGSTAPAATTRDTATTLSVSGAVLAVCLGLFACDTPAEVVAADRMQSIVAPDLRARATLRGGTDAQVDVIVQVTPGKVDLECRDNRLGAGRAPFDHRSAVASFGGRVRGTFQRLGQISVTLPASSLQELAACAAVRRISPDRELFAMKQKGAQPTVALVSDLAARTTGAAAVHGGSSIQPRTGAGVTIATLDSGVQTSHKGFAGKPPQWWAGQLSFGKNGALKFTTGAGSDPYGHGTLVAGAMASSAASVKGLAPGARILSVQLLDRYGVGKVSQAIAAIDWLITHGKSHGVRVINISLAAAPVESYTTDPLGQAVAEAVRAGFVVVAAAGNVGWSDGQQVYGGIGSPANHPAVITVGASHTHNTVLRADDGVAWFSSRGPTLIDGVAKPDLVAPGVELPLPLPAGSRLHRQALGVDLELPTKAGAHPWIASSGTSFATPLVSATVALMLEAQSNLTPTQVKAILQTTAQALNADSAADSHPLAVGAGLLNALGAVELASIWNTDPQLEPGDDNLLAPIADQPVSVIEGGDVLWGTGIIWNGMVASQSWWKQLSYAWLFVGDLSGTGIIWNGMEADQGQIVWLDYNVSGIDLVRRRQQAWESDVLWGTGIIWNGTISFETSASFGPVAKSLWWSALVSPGGFASQLSSAGPIVVPGTNPTGLTDGSDAGWIHVPNFNL